MILITSGNYLNSEFTSITGQLPPSFLPVGNRRLYHRQAQSFGDLADSIVLTLPEDFIIPDVDQAAIDALGIEILKMPPNLSLGAAIVYAINVRNLGNEPVRILHGDTLCGRLGDIDLDVVLTGTTSDNYPWAHCEKNEDGSLRLSQALLSKKPPRCVLAGYFTFSNGGNLAHCLTLAKNDFVEGLDLYSRKYGLAERDCPDWLDFGHVPLYYRSKAKLTTERAFNNLKATPAWIDKTSVDQEKIDAEANWFENLPPELSIYTPRYLGRQVAPDGQSGYRLEYLYLSTLSELAVFGDLPAISWQPIFSRLDELMTLMRAKRAPQSHPPVTRKTYLDKTLSRLSDFASSETLNMSTPFRFGGKPLPSLNQIADTVCAAITDAVPSEMTLMHGDLCYSNLFFDLRSHQLRIIDPRGRSFNGVVSLYGDCRYDLAKLSHSVIGRYDTIIAGRYNLRRNSNYDIDLVLPQQNNLDEVEVLFRDMTFAGLSPNDPSVAAIMVSLFLSMLPLHYDDKDRQYALLANALRLFADFD